MYVHRTNGLLHSRLIMKINEVTNKRLDEFWAQALTLLGAAGKVGSKLLSKTPKKVPKSNKADFDNIPLPKKVTGKVHTDPKMGNTAKWKKDSNLDIQDMATKVRQGN